MSTHASTNNPENLVKNEIPQSHHSEIPVQNGETVRLDASTYPSPMTQLTEEQDSLQRQRDDLQRRYNELQHQYNELQHQYNELQHQYNDLQRQCGDPQLTGKGAANKGHWWFPNDKLTQENEKLTQELQAKTKSYNELKDKYSKKKQHLKNTDAEVNELQRQLRKLGDESQQLRNALAFSAGDHQSWVLDSIVVELAQVKNKVKSALFRLEVPTNRRLDWLSLFSTITFDIAVDLMKDYINEVTTLLGYSDNEGSDPNRNSLAFRTRLFIKSVLQINFGSIDQMMLSRFIPSLQDRLGIIARQPHSNVLSELALLGVDDNVIKSLAIFTLKLQLLEPPVRHRFKPQTESPEDRLLGGLLNNIQDKLYLFPAIDQWSNQRGDWLETQVQLTYID